MKSALRGRLASITLFMLVVILIVGGMSWATVATVELAKRNLGEERSNAYERNIALALGRLDTHVGIVLGNEIARSFTDYFPYETVEPVEIWFGRNNVNVPLEADRFVVLSPLAEGNPSHDWIDLYFQVSDDGQWSSPQIRNDLPLDHPCRRTLDWLSGIMPVATLGERVAKALNRADFPAAAAGKGQAPRSVQITHRLMRRRAVPGSLLTGDYLRQRTGKIVTQFRSRPTDQCLRPGAGADNVADIVPPHRDADSGAEIVSVRIVPGRGMATFWLEPSPSGRAKLACVRQGYIDDRVVYQGFVGDWSRLKRELLAQIEGDFPEAELVPYSDDAPPQPQDSRLTMYTVPALLRVSDLPPLPTGDAWRSVAGMLLITWGAAIAVLVVAGLGFRNLVALTERRMQFAYAVTHELRTPLTTFRLYADMLSAGLVPQDKQSEYLDTLNRESLRLSRLVEGVLEYARLENHKVRLNLVEMSSASLLESIDETLSKPCEENEIEIRMDNLLAADKRLHTDISVIRQIAGVLINNACRHTRGAANPVVCVQLSGENGNVHLDVADSGPGIERSEARTIFKPFRRGREADAHAQGGIGLGLALARSWARLLGGRLDLVARHDPELGGARFRLTFPTETRV